jgi:DNA-binding transcriptional ArsR family regulator
MPSAAPELIPVFRSETQARLLAEVFFGQPASGSELARRLGLLQSTVARELGRLADAGVVTFEQVGRSKIVRPADAPFRSALSQLVAYAAGLPHIVRGEYADVGDIDEVFIHGSWAARFNGEPGPPPNDVDLVIVSPTHTRFSLAEHRAAIEAATDLSVDQIVVPPDHPDLDRLRRGSVPVIERHAP